MNKMFSTMLLFLLIIPTVISAENMVTDDLKNAMKKSSKGEMLRINIIMKAQKDFADLYSEAKELSRSERRQFVIEELETFTRKAQKEILHELDNFSKNEQIADIRTLWVSNVINCYATAEVIEAISQRKDIEMIDHDEKRNMLIAVNRDKARQVEGHPESREITWNVSLVNADDVWMQGYQGSGVVVAVLDTGVNYDHNDLDDHMWTHPSYPNHGWDYAYDDNDPMDGDGHGTHCAGTIAGDGTSGSQTGIAPDASIMALKILDDDGGGYESDVWDAIQFSIDNGADVMSMSIGWMHAWNPTRSTWRNTMNNALAAGLIASVAAANSGDEQYQYPIPDNVATPGDCPPPWLNPDQTLNGGVSDVVCVGATDSSDNIASFSSRGPVTWENISPFSDYAYDPEMGLIRPDVSAPGVNIKSLDYSNNSGYADGWSGTSMATPCNAGIIALMLSKNNNLTPVEISQILEENAVSLPNTNSDKNNDYGSGRVDALASVNAVTLPNTPPNAAINPNPADGATDVPLPETIIWLNGGGATSYQVYFGTDNPPTNIVNGATVTTSNYTLSNALSYNTQYYWRVDSYNSFGSASGTLWDFTTTSPPDEDFETGDFFANPWTFSGDANWNIDSSNYYEGSYSTQSGDIDDNQTSELNITLNIISPGNIIFYKKVSSESGYDFLIFEIDGTEQDSWSGEVGWSMESYSVSVGTHTFTWKFSKDYSVSNGSDCAWIDFIFFPPMTAPEPGFSMSPTSLDFGDVGINTTATEQFSITNTGGATLSGNITTPHDVYSVAEVSDQFNRRKVLTPTDETLNYDVGVGQTAYFDLDFSPASNTAYEGNITITSNDNTNQTNYLAVSGTGVDPADISISPNSISKTLSPNSTSSENLIIGNNGIIDLTYSASITYNSDSRETVTLSPQNDNYWTGSCTSSSKTETSLVNAHNDEDGWMKFDVSTIPDGSTINSIEFHGYINDNNWPYWAITDVSLDPLTASASDLKSDIETGDYNYFQDSYNTPNGWRVETLEGNANSDLEAALAQDWFCIGINSTDDNTTYYIEFDGWNEANQPYLVVDYTSSIPSGWLTLDGASSISGTVLSGNNDNIVVGFDSSDLTEDTYSATIAIDSNDPDQSNVTIPITMNIGVYPEIAVSPASLDFGDVLTGDSETLQFTIENTGTAELTGDIITPTGWTIAEASDFVSRDEISENVLSYTISEGEVQIFNLEFSPTVEQTYSGNVIISHNAGGEDELITVSGNGIVLDSPTGLMITIDGNNVNLHWDQVAEADSYNIYRSENPDSGFERIGISPTNSYIDVDAGLENKYFYYITAE